MGCGPAKTKWLKVVWDADVPVGTGITFRARSADDPTALSTAPWTGNYSVSPADLAAAPGPLVPNPSGYIQVEFDLTTTDKNLTPALKSFQILSECINTLG